ncbi:MAG TPA: hypothetical protein VLA82_03075 [Actinomycetota bacterium]|nr:hypothetical protein [Actinomycetota bacterium]
MVRFQRQPPGTAITRASLLVGGGLAGVAAWRIVAGERVGPALLAGVGATLLLVGSHRANHGAGGPVDRMLGELLDRAWDGLVLAPIAWVTRVDEPGIALGALVAICASFLSSYVRARGAALRYSVEESHVTRGVRYALVAAGLAFDALGVAVWSAAVVSVLAVLVRISQVAKEERA